MSLLESYYDRNRADRFEALFSGTDIDRRPTANRHRYVILRFDFSAFDDTLETLRERFETYCLIKLRGALERNRDLFSEPVIDRILAHPSIDGKLNQLFEYAGEHAIPLYVLIDEYENFANTVLAYRGAEAYQSFTHGGGFYRSFFATLKAGAGHGGGVERMFITGVSPITMDDVTSGFNIGTNISLHRNFNEMLGFTAAEVRTVLEMYRDHGVFDQDVDETMAVVVRAFFAAYVGLTDHFVLHSEQELNNGYADLYLEPFTSRHPDIGYGYVIEFKYVKRGEKLDESRAKDAARDATDQLRGYLRDERLVRNPRVRHVGLALVFHGWELAACEAVELPHPR